MIMLSAFTLGFPLGFAQKLNLKGSSSQMADLQRRLIQIGCGVWLESSECARSHLGANLMLTNMALLRGRMLVIRYKD